MINPVTLKQKINICFILADKNQIPSWYLHTIKEVIALPFVEVSFIEFKNKINVYEGTSLAFKKFKLFEDWWFKNEFDANGKIAFNSILPSANIFEADNNDWHIPEETISKFKLFQFDIIYDISYDIRRNENISQLAKYGLWFIHFGYGKYKDKHISGFWEVMESHPVTGSYMLMCKNHKCRILKDGTTRTIFFSVKNNFNSIAWKSASYLTYKLKEIWEIGFQSSKNGQLIDIHNDALGQPGNFRMLFFFLRNFAQYVLHKLKSKVNKERFSISFYKGGFALNQLDNLNLKELIYPKESFHADPFVIDYNNKHIIFFEEFTYSNNKGHISFIEINQLGQVSTPNMILDKPYHLSYPFVFIWNDEFYMIPESSAAGTVELYKANEFPHKWELVKNLFEDVELIDVTVHFENGLWWLFANSRNHPFVSTNDQLHLYYSSDLLGNDWKAHPKNPIATHAENCRPAGRIFRMNNELFRPAQNNASQQYGYGLKINRIDILNEIEYQETEVYSLSPKDYGLKAIHHMDFSPTLLVTDGIKAK